MKILQRIFKRKPPLIRYLNRQFLKSKYENLPYVFVERAIFDIIHSNCGGLENGIMILCEGVSCEKYWFKGKVIKSKLK